MNEPHTHEWKYGEPVYGMTTTTMGGTAFTSPAGVLRFCTGCALMERMELHFAPKEKQTHE